MAAGSGLCFFCPFDSNGALRTAAVAFTAAVLFWIFQLQPAHAWKTDTHVAMIDDLSGMSRAETKMKERYPSVTKEDIEYLHKSLRYGVLWPDDCKDKPGDWERHCSEPFAQNEEARRDQVYNPEVGHICRRIQNELRDKAKELGFEDKSKHLDIAHWFETRDLAPEFEHELTASCGTADENARHFLERAKDLISLADNELVNEIPGSRTPHVETLARGLHLLGRSLHYVQDVAVPHHAASVETFLNRPDSLVGHYNLEEWIGNNWSKFSIAFTPVEGRERSLDSLQQAVEELAYQAYENFSRKQNLSMNVFEINNEEVFDTLYNDLNYKEIIRQLGDLSADFMRTAAPSLMFVPDDDDLDCGLGSDLHRC